MGGGGVEVRARGGVRGDGGRGGGGARRWWRPPRKDAGRVGCGWRWKRGEAVGVGSAAERAHRPHDRRLPLEEIIAERACAAGGWGVLREVLELLLDAFGGGTAGHG